jgi:alkylation response protein AidB-like acyl-CoA dehydrogenase
MRFAFSDEQLALKREARRALAANADLAGLGWMGLVIPEKFGGAGLGWVELCAILEECGRVLSPVPLLSTAIASKALLACAPQHLPAIAEGRLTASPVTENGLAFDADIFVAGDRVVTQKVPVDTLDLTRPMVRVEGAAPLSDDLLAHACIALAAEQVGGAERCLEMAVDYAKTRHQFGRPIGSFQAIKHMCADMLVRVESARSACYWAAWCAAAGDPELLVAASTAKAWCSEAYFKNAADNLQIHGGIGFTWEHDAHRYLRRARATSALFGDPAHHRDLVAARIGL